MGQYKSWLHYREIDQQLQTQLTQLTTQLDALKEQAHLLDEGLSLGHNPILQALLTQLVATPTLASTVTAPLYSPPDTSAMPANGTPQLTSSSTNGYSTPFSQLPSNGTTDSLPLTRPISTPHPELDLLPTDLSSFVDEHTQTAPVRTPPWWQRRIKTPTQVPASASPIAPASSFYGLQDQQSERTNHLVQRWFERWNHNPEPSRREEE
jgi:hypothetical protein